MASWAIPSTVTHDQALRLAKNLMGVLAEQGGGGARAIDGTITVSDTTSNGQVVLRVAVTGRNNSNANVTLDA
jgi:hypothetical protein